MIINYENQEHRERIMLAIKLMKAGYITHELNELMQKHCGISKKTADDFLTEARKVIKADVQEAAALLREQQIMRYLDLYRKALEDNNLKVANATLANIDKLYALQTIKTEQTGEITVKFE